MKEELTKFSSKEKIFILSAMFCGFFIAAEYAVIRPVSNALLITSFSSSIFPYLWLATVPVNLLVVSLYNRYLSKVGILPMFFLVGFLIVGFSMLGPYFSSYPSLTIGYYIWKEIYIMLMFQQLWSMIHSTIAPSRAKYLYGILFGVGGLGGALGSILPGFFAVSIGSEKLLFFTLPLYLCLAFCFWHAFRNSSVVTFEKKDTSFFEGFQKIAGSKVLTYIFFAVLFMQLSSAIVEYQFNHHLEKNILGKDLRTEYCGKIFGAVNLITTSMQFVGVYLLLRWIGLQRSHLFVPLALLTNSLTFLVFPLFGVISYCYVAVKAFDFSIFGVIREMLYIPLKQEEKFQAKAVIDVFIHRSSKALASFLILFFQMFGKERSQSVMGFLLLLIFSLWVFIAYRLLKKEEIIA